MARAERAEGVWRRIGAFARERRGEAEAALHRIASEGPLAASDFPGPSGGGGWWEWSDAKVALEWLFWSGFITTAARRGSFERVYDLTERVIPADILSLPTPDAEEAQRRLLELSAIALGVATAGTCATIFGWAWKPSRASTSWSREGRSSRSRCRAGNSLPTGTSMPSGRARSAPRRSSLPSIR
jgi:uncharacterized protein YcaQ